MLRPFRIKVLSLCIQANSLLSLSEWDLGASFGNFMYSSMCMVIFGSSWSLRLWKCLATVDNCGTTGYKLGNITWALEIEEFQVGQIVQLYLQCDSVIQAGRKTIWQVYSQLNIPLLEHLSTSVINPTKSKFFYYYNYSLSTVPRASLWPKKGALIIADCIMHISIRERQFFGHCLHSITGQ